MASERKHPTRIFQNPEDLLAKWEEYKADLKIKEWEWTKVQYVGKDGQRVEDNTKLPYTFEGFKRFCWDTEVGNIEQYFVNQNDYYDDFVSICSRIKNEIRENQIIGGMNGFFNASITQRLNGLADKKEINDSREPRVFNID